VAIAFPPGHFGLQEHRCLVETFQVTVTTTPVRLLAQSLNRFSAVITNVSGATIYIGGSQAVTSLSGHALLIGSSLTLNGNEMVWGVVASVPALATVLWEEVR
jgi:hypothetical protein